MAACDLALKGRYEIAWGANPRSASKTQCRALEGRHGRWDGEAHFGSCHPSGVRTSRRSSTWGLHPRLFRDTPPALRTTFASGVSHQLRLRFSPLPTLAFRSDAIRRRRFESYKPTPFWTIIKMLDYNPNRRFDSSSKKSTFLNGSCPMSCQRIFPAASIKNVPCNGCPSKSS